jgi:methionyl aminopeptidase
MNQEHQLTAMREGGRLLAEVKQGLAAAVKPNQPVEELESLAQQLIKERGATPSFSTVPGYRWATCLMINEEMCHGIPQGKVIQDGDVVKIDVGLIWQGFHLDTTTSVIAGKAQSEDQTFLDVGRQALNKAMAKATVGHTIYDISLAMQRVVEAAGYNCVYQLTGHGIGLELHQEPNIPCLAQRSDKRLRLQAGQTLAIEIMYTRGQPHLVLAKDGWTYVTADGSMSGMFEETVIVGQRSPEILTR